MKRTFTVLLVGILSVVSIVAQANNDKRTEKSNMQNGVLEVGQRTTYLKEGLSTEEVVRLLGEPSSVSERTEKGKVVISYEFARGTGRTLIAEFVNNVLVHSQVNEVSIPSTRVAG